MPALSMVITEAFMRSARNSYRSKDILSDVFR